MPNDRFPPAARNLPWPDYPFGAPAGETEAERDRRWAWECEGLGSPGGIMCSVCGAAVIAAHTPAGVLLLLDPEPHPEGAVLLGDDGAEVLSGRELRECRARGMALHRPHAVACPKRKREAERR